MFKSYWDPQDKKLYKKFWILEGHSLNWLSINRGGLLAEVKPGIIVSNDNFDKIVFESWEDIKWENDDEGEPIITGINNNVKYSDYWDVLNYAEHWGEYVGRKIIVFESHEELKIYHKQLNNQEKLLPEIENFPTLKYFFINEMNARMGGHNKNYFYLTLVSGFETYVRVIKELGEDLFECEILNCNGDMYNMFFKHNPDVKIETYKTPVGTIFSMIVPKNMLYTDPSATKY